MAEWLRRLTRKPKVRTAVGSNPALDSLVAVRNSSPGRPVLCEGNLVAAAGSCGGLMVKHPWPLLEISLSDFHRLATLNINAYLPRVQLRAWIQSPSRSYKPFVSSRIGEIQSNSDPSQWIHIPSEDNVADDLSRGIHVHELNGRWMHGPDFLQLEEELWPTKYGPAPAEEDNERRQATKVHMVINSRGENIIDYERFSSWTRLIRVTAWIKRLAENIRQRKRNQTRHDGPWTPEELQKAEMFLIKDAQNNLHDRLKRGEFKSLSPFTDDKGIIRVGGRLDKAIVSHETRHPALLPNDHRISLLIIRHVHQHRHTGVATTTAKIRRKYWMLQGNKISKSVKFKCVLCRELAHKAEEQHMANLPSLRLTPQTQPVTISDRTMSGLDVTIQQSIIESFSHV